MRIILDDLLYFQRLEYNVRLLQYDEGKICLNITIDSEDIINSVKVLVEKGKALQDYDHGIKIKLDGELLIDLINEKLRILF